VRRIGVLTIIMVFASVFLLNTSLGQQATPSLQVSSLVRIIPADGKTYPVVVVSLVLNNKPAVALSSFNVFLSSSNPAVGTVPPVVNFPVGSSFILVNFTTTNTPGPTTITATAQGYGSGSQQFQTSALGGFPSSIGVFAAPQQAVAQTSYTGSLIVELLDSRGNPAQATNQTVISLTSSNPVSVSLVTNQVVLQPGQTIAVGTYSSGLVVGGATITASAPGLTKGTVTVNVLGSTPSQIRVQAVPPLAPLNSNGLFAVWLADQNGNPTIASSEVVLNLVSSNTTVLTVQSQATIPVGSNYLDIPFQTHAKGSAVVTVSSSGLTSGTVSVQVSQPKPPTSLQIVLAPQPILANNRTTTSVFVYLLGNGAPSLALSDINVVLASQNPNIASIPNSVTIPAGQPFASVSVKSSFFVGSSQITASAQNLLPAPPQTITAFGNAPNALVATSLPQVLPANGGTYPSLLISLQSQSGLPANAPTPIAVTIRSSNPSVIPINTTVTINAGQSAVLVPIPTTSTPGTASVTVTASGFASSTTQFSTISPGASQLGFQVAPQPGMITPSGVAGEFALELLDQNGNPVQTKVNVPVVITADNTSVIHSQMVINLEAGTTLAVFQLKADNPGTTQLTASGPGLSPAKVQATFVPFPVSAKIGANRNFAYLNETVVVDVQVNLQNEPFAGVPVAWSSTGGQLNVTSSKTDDKGVAIATFRSSLPGTYNVTALVGGQGSNAIRLVYQITVLAQVPPTQTVTTTSQQAGLTILGLPLSAFLTVVVGVAAGIIIVFTVYRFRDRIRGRKRTILLPGESKKNP
jgi:hypothetical protein